MESDSPRCAASQREEAYSVAILVREALDDDIGNWCLHLFATDIDSASLHLASRGIYAKESVENTKYGVLDRYFNHHENGFEVKPEIKSMVSFSMHDLTSPKTISPQESVFGTFDIVLCRNVLIYFSRDLQAEVLKKLCKSLGEEGYLILGETESLVENHGLSCTAIDRKNRIYQKICAPK